MQDYIFDRFLSYAKAVASRSGYTFASNCEADMQSLIQMATAKLQGVNVQEQQNAIRVAENNLETLVLEMIRNVPPGGKELQEFTLSNARAKLCPLYPFC